MKIRMFYSINQIEHLIQSEHLIVGEHHTHTHTKLTQTYLPLEISEPVQIIHQLYEFEQVKLASLNCSFLNSK